MAEDGDIKVHEATYHKVIGLLKYGAAACFLLAFIIIYFALAPASK
ncbi:aa3-type cytochrome c oxidase subunit IV [Sphingomonas populi]|uniref:Aa3-type cytochrome c oxidase subunit IV n=1 Tax=Sphingomonas populi TaxID=2484750 RepID=A0A4Q6XYT9_9SPHN|nr:aa3-type cytochrome c oxidase subunit IV [Sphingomonas populi]RZF65181.1 aa3-type cytochrome c oxidase subunit IV [Sphingomonas populi]